MFKIDPDRVSAFDRLRFRFSTETSLRRFTIQTIYQGLDSVNPRIALKFRVIRLWLTGKSQGRICKLTGLSRNTVKSYLRQYDDFGLASLFTFYNKKNTDRLTEACIKFYDDDWDTLIIHNNYR